MSTKYPASIDDNISLPQIIDNVSPVDANAFNRLRQAIVAIEAELGASPSGTDGTVRNRFDTLETLIQSIGGVSIAGDLGGNALSPKVIGLQGKPITATPPTEGYILAYVSGVWQSIPNTSGSTLSGDVTGTAGANTVVKLQNRSVASTAPQDGYALVYNAGASQWQPKLLSTGSILAGDVTGSATANTVTKFQGRAFSSTSPTDGYTIQWVAVDNSWEPKPTVANLSGDLAGNTQFATVTKLQGRAVSTTAPTDGYILRYSATASQWQPQVFPSVADGYLTFTYKPGGTATGSVFTSWTSLMARRNQTTGPATIIIDDSITSPALVDTGTWNLGKNTSIRGYRGNDGVTIPILQIPEGAVFQNPYEFRNIKILGAAISTANIIAASPFVSVDIYAYDTIFRTINSASASLIQATRGYFTLDGYSKFENISNGASVISGTLGADINFNLNDRSIIDAHTMNLIGGSNINIYINDSAAYFNTVQDSSATTNVKGANFVSNLASVPDGYVLSKLGVGNTSWIPGGAFGLTLGGDVFGSLTNNLISSNVVDNTKLRTSGALSVIGRSANSTGNVADISGTDGQYLRISGTTLGFGTINLANSSSFSGTLPTTLQDAQSLGGDLSGTTSLATVVKLQNRSVASTAPIDGYALLWVAANNDWEPKPVLTGNLSGDVTGSAVANTVVKFQNRAFASTAPTDGYVITWDQSGNTWKPAAPTTAGSLNGDVTGLATSNTVVKINGASVTTIGSANTLLGTTDGTNITYFALTNSQVDVAAAIAGTKISPNFGSQNILTTGGIFLGTSSATSGLIGVPHNNDFLQGRNSAGSGNIVLMNWGTQPNRLTFGSSSITDGYYNVATAGTHVLQINAVDKYKFTASSADWKNNSLINLANPVNPQDAATKAYVDGYTYSSLSILGDVTGSLGASTVAKIQGNSVQSGVLGAAQDGYTLVWNNSNNRYEPKPVLTSVTLAGDVTGSAAANTVTKIQNKTVDSAAPSDGYLLIWNSSSTRWNVGNRFVDMGLQKITNMANPTAAQDAATKTYSDGHINGTALSIGSANTVLGTTDGTNVSYFQVVNAQISSSAAIAVSKLAASSTDGYYLNTTAGVPTWKSQATDTLLGRDTAGTGALESISLDSTLEFTGSQVIRRAALTGDVTASAGSNSVTVTKVNGATFPSIGSANTVLGTADGVNLTYFKIFDGYVASNAAIAVSKLATGAANTVLVSNGTVDNFAQIVDGYIASNAAIAVSKLAASSTDGYYLNTTSGVPTWKSLTTDSLLGRDTGGTGALEAITLDSTLEFTGTQSIRRAALSGDISASAGSNTTAIGANKVLDTMLRTSGALSVIGRSANSSGNVADISGTNNQVLRISGSVLGFGTVDLATMTTASNDVSLNSHKLTSVATPTVSTDAATKGYIDGYAFSSLSIIGDVSGTLGATSVVKLQNRTLSSSAPTDGYTLTWDNGTSTWVTTGHFIDTGSASNYIKFGGGSGASGLIRLPNNSAGLTSRNAANTADVTAITVDASNVVVLGGAGTPNAVRVYANATTNFTAAINGNDEYVYSSTAADFKDNSLQFGTNPASSGLIRAPQASNILFGRNNANTQNSPLIRWGAASPLAGNDLLYIGSTSGDSGKVANIVFGVDTSGSFSYEINGNQEYSFNSTIADFKDNSLQFGTNPASSGTVRFPGSTQIMLAQRNVANSANITVLQSDNADGLVLGDNSNSASIIYGVKTGGTHKIQVNNTDEYVFNSTTADFKDNSLQFGTNPASSGLVRIPNNITVLGGRNATNTTDVTLIRWGASSSTSTMTLGENNTISEIEYRVASGGQHSIVVANGLEYAFTSTNADFKNNTITNLSALNTITVALGVKASNLTDANLTRGVTDGYIHELPASTLSTARTFTPSLTGAINGHILSIRRFDISANTYTIKNNAGTSNLFVMPPSAKYQVDIRYSSTLGDWELGGAWGLA